MYKIGEFSVLSKTTIKALRYYEKEKLLMPAFLDDNGYRYYEAKQLVDLAKIISLRQVGISINDIKEYLNGSDFNELLKKRKSELTSVLPWRAAAERCFSWSNRNAILALPERIRATQTQREP
jgi:DNA-binding transcriptional MerR regulator